MRAELPASDSLTTSKQSTSTPSRPSILISETVSEIQTLDDSLAVAVPEDYEGSVKYVLDMLSVLRPNDERAFKLARRIGERAKYSKDHRPHGSYNRISLMVAG